MLGYGDGERVRNASALAGHGRGGGARRHRAHDRHAARAVAAIADLGPASGDGQACRSANQDWAQHLLLRSSKPSATRAKQNTNGPLRQYFPKGTYLTAHDAADLDAVAHALNARPRRALGWRTPGEALNAALREAQETSVATTGRVRPTLFAGIQKGPVRTRI